MHNAKYSCGAVSYEITGQPLLRAFCHCTICQKANKAPFGDITMFRAKGVIMPDREGIDYKAFKSPKVVQRGFCRSCNTVAVEYLQLFRTPSIVMIATKNITGAAFVPEPSMHTFYDTRVSDIDDDLPKY